MRARAKFSQRDMGNVVDLTRPIRNKSIVKKEIPVTVWRIRYLHHICMVGTQGCMRMAMNL
jgi:hypothetical protein